MIITYILTIIILTFATKVYIKRKGDKGKTEKITTSARKIIEREQDAYERKMFLTKRERNFFIRINNIIKTDDYCILAQVRVADIISPNKKYLQRSKEHTALFRQISQSHVDFAIMNKRSFEIEFAIELDDRSHNQKKRMERDDILNKAFAQAGVTLIRTMSYEDLIEKETVIRKVVKNQITSYKTKQN